MDSIIILFNLLRYQKKHVASFWASDICALRVPSRIFLHSLWGNRINFLIKYNTFLYFDVYYCMALAIVAGLSEEKNRLTAIALRAV